MTKDEILKVLSDGGWEVLFSVPSPYKSWGEHMVEIKGPNGLIAGYGKDEVDALSVALERVNSRSAK